MTSEARRHVRPRRQKQHRHDGEQMGTLIPGAFPSRIDQCRMARRGSDCVGILYSKIHRGHRMSYALRFRRLARSTPTSRPDYRFGFAHYSSFR